MNLPLSITPEDFKNSSGDFLDVYNCPLATAVKRQYPELVDVAVCTRYLYYGGKLSGTLYLTDPFTEDKFDAVRDGYTFKTELISKPAHILNVWKTLVYSVQEC